MSKKIIIALVIVLAIIILISVSSGDKTEEVMEENKEASETEEVMEENQEAEEEEVSAAPAPVISAPSYASVIYGYNGFSPAVVTIKRGGSVTLSNIKSTRGLQVVSDSGVFASKNLVHLDESDTFTLHSPGTYTYYNKLKPEHRGTIVVK